MNSEIVQYSVKLKTVLKKLLTSNFQVRSDSEFHLLLSHLTSNENPGFCEQLLELSLFNEWIVQACTYWERHGILPSVNIITFTMELLSLVSINEKKFLELSSSKIYSRLINIAQVRGCNDQSIRLAFIKLLSSLLQHETGFGWIIANNMWTPVLTFCSTNSVVCLIKDASSLMYKLLQKAAEYNSELINNVIEKIMWCLTGHLKITNDVNEEEVTPTFRLIASIMEQYCKNKCSQKSNTFIPTIFLRNYRLEQIINNCMTVARNEDFTFELENVTLSIYFTKLCAEINKPTFVVDQFNATSKNIYKLLERNISQNYNTNVIKLCYLCIHYMSYIKSKFPSQVNIEDLVIFEKRIVLMQIIPLCLIPENICALTVDVLESDEIRDYYADQVYEFLCSHSIRMFYSWRRHLMDEEQFWFELSFKALLYILQSRKYYSREMGVMMFQAIVYCLHDFVNTMKVNQQLLDTCMRRSVYMYTIFNAAVIMIEDFEITWKDCFETANVMGNAIDFINMADWTPNVVVQVMKLINLSIVKYMLPNLALLVDRTSDSAMDMLGPLLTTQLENEHWEVRNAAIEILCTISEIAHAKFPCLQRIILKENLAKPLTNMCTSESHAFVRSSALKCLQKMIVMPAFWFQALDTAEILKKLTYILNEETESQVRLEATALAVNICRHHSLPEQMKTQMHKLMTHSVIADLHWTVKAKALEYWDLIIDESLKNQGMVDGAFPSVTFSKENRKIVTLTDSEIQRRLHKTLGQLSECGCLGVILSAMQDDCDMEVVKKAIVITKKVLKLMKQYNMYSNDSKTYDRLSSTMTVCESVDCMSLFDEEVANGNGLKIVSPIEFINFVTQDLDDFVNIRKEWLNETDQLNIALNDILKNFDKIP